MAEATINPLFLSLLSTLLVALMLPPCHRVTAKPDGLTLKLISRNSPESPFYQPNLTYEQRIQDLAHQLARAQYLMTTLASKKNQTLDSFTPETVHMIFNNFQDLASYHVRIGVGTLSTAPQYKSYNLLVDTGSDLTWLQCDGCRTHCFKSVDEPFPISASSSYKPLPCRNHPLCEADCDGEFCAFIRTYGDGHTTVQGVLASETLSFESSTGPPGSRELV
ncbi:hypothetical protein ACFX13_037441 [Malus domestica]